MDAGQLFEQLQIKSKQNSNDIAVVLDAVITTIVEKVNSGQSIEFADFGHFQQSDYGKLDFAVSSSFSKIINYKYDGMDSVPLSESDRSALSEQSGEIETSDVPAVSFDQVPEVNYQDESVTPDSDNLQDMFIDESANEPVHDFIEQPVSEDRIVLPEAPPINYETEEPSEYTIDIKEVEIESVPESSDVTNEEKPASSVSSYVTEILDDIQTQQEKPEPTPSFYERDEPVAQPNIRKLDTVIVEESLNEKKKEMPMQSYSSTGYQEPKRQETPTDEEYSGSGLSNSELGNDTDGSKKWMIILGVAILGVAIGIWIFFHLDTKDAAKPIADNDTTQTEVIDSAAMTGSQQQISDPFEDTSAPAEATPKTVSKKGKSSSKEAKKETKAAVKPTKPEPKTAVKNSKSVSSAPAKTTPATTKTVAAKTPVKKSEPVSAPDVSGSGSVDYSGIARISGLKGTFEQSKGGFTITVSSWSKKTQAEREMKRWTDAGVAASVSEVYLADKNGYWYRVRIGQFKTRKEASSAASEVKNELPGAYVVDAAAD